MTPQILINVEGTGWEGRVGGVFRLKCGAFGREEGTCHLHEYVQTQGQGYGTPHPGIALYGIKFRTLVGRMRKITGGADKIVGWQREYTLAIIRSSRAPLMSGRVKATKKRAYSRWVIRSNACSPLAASSTSQAQNAVSSSRMRRRLGRLSSATSTRRGVGSGIVGMMYGGSGKIQCGRTLFASFVRTDR